MIPTDILQSVRTLVLHDHCADGLASALLLRDALPNVELLFAQYGSPAHRELPATPGMLFCDFSPPLERAEEFARAGAVVLDHHRTAEPVVRAMGERGIFGDEALDPGVCGAVLAYRHVWQPLRRGDGSDVNALDAFAERFATLAGVHDTWQTKDARWHAARAQVELLRFLPREDWLSHTLAEIAQTWDADVARFGEGLLAKNEDRVAYTIKGAHRFTTPAGKRVVAFEGTSISSDAAEAIDKDADIVVGFGFGVEAGQPKMRFSVRSHTGFDCAAFARERGGGGHTAAAGFAVMLTPSDPHPYAMVERLFAS